MTWYSDEYETLADYKYAQRSKESTMPTAKVYHRGDHGWAVIMSDNPQTHHLFSSLPAALDYVKTIAERHT